MRVAQDRVAHLRIHYRRDDLAAMLQHALPEAYRRGEIVALYALVCAFWGILMYAAAQFALP